MNINEYQHLAARTLIKKPDFQIDGWRVMITWNVLGLVGEAGELAQLCESGIIVDPNLVMSKLIKELGDVLWYVAALCTKLSVLMDEIVIENISHPAPWAPDGVVREAYRVAELIKKGIFHQHGIPRDDLLLNLGRIMWYVDAICEKIGLSIEDVAEENIKKLQERYPNGYNSSDSIARVDIGKDG